MPWLQHGWRKKDGSALRLRDCDGCRETVDPAWRRAVGCGFLPLDPNAMPWDATPLGRDPHPDELDKKSGRLLLPVCPGYACGLPEVIEASMAHTFFKNGGLEQACDGAHPTPDLRYAVVILETEYGRVLAAESQEQKP